MNFKYAETKYNNYKSRKKSIVYLVNKIIYSENIIFTNPDKSIMISKLDNFFTTAQKDNYEMIFVIIIFQDLIKMKNNIVNLINFLVMENSNDKIKNNNEFEYYSKLLFYIICLIVGKYYDDYAMINDDYTVILKKEYTKQTINNMEYKILKLMNFHFKSDYLNDFFDCYNLINN